MRKVKEDGDWYMFDPHECKELHDLFGAKFDEKYQEYIDLAEGGKLKSFHKILQIGKEKITIGTI